MHLESHKKISEASQVPITKILQNGKCLKIAPGECYVVDDIETGKLIVEGKYLYNSDSDFIRDRRKFSFEGIEEIFVLNQVNRNLFHEICKSAFCTKT